MAERLHWKEKKHDTMCPLNLIFSLIRLPLIKSHILTLKILPELATWIYQLIESDFRRGWTVISMTRMESQQLTWGVSVRSLTCSQQVAL